MQSPNAEDVEQFVEHAVTVVGSEFVGADRCVSPADAEQVSHLLRFADDRGIPLRIQGAGTKTTWVDRDNKSCVTLDSRRMNAVVEHTWQDMTCTVQAGCNWAALQGRLATQGQFVALDPLWPERATVGGVVATNDSGVLRLRYGGLRDLLIGMTVVLADGTVARSGGKVVKNVAGYDLPKLMCGSFGTLAFIVDVTFRLHSKPLNTATFTAKCKTAEPLAQTMLEIMKRHFSTQSMQLRGDADGFALDVRLMSIEPVIAAQEAQLMALAATVRSDDTVWDARQRIFDLHEDGFIFKASSLTTELSEVVQKIVDAGGAAVAQSVGILYGWLPGESVDTVQQLRAGLERSGGSLRVLQASSHATLDRWGKLPDAIPLMREVKKQFDPQKILNPGCFVGGI